MAQITYEVAGRAPLSTYGRWGGDTEQPACSGTCAVGTDPACVFNIIGRVRQALREASTG